MHVCTYVRTGLYIHMNYICRKGFILCLASYMYTLQYVPIQVLVYIRMYVENLPYGQTLLSIFCLYMKVTLMHYPETPSI